MGAYIPKIKEPVIVNSGALTDGRAVVIRRSGRTGQLVVRMTEARGAYKVGDEVSVSPHECRPYKIAAPVRNDLADVNKLMSLLDGLEQKPRAYLTEKEGLMLHDIAEDYWHAFSQLVADYLERAPHKLQDELLVRLEDKSSAHGSDFLRYMKRPPPFVERFNNILKNGIGGKT